MVTGGVPVNAAATGEERALQHGNLPSVNDHLPAVWKRIGEDARRQHLLVVPNPAGHEIPDLRVSPLADFVAHKIRILIDESSDKKRRGRKGELALALPPNACAHIRSPRFLKNSWQREKRSRRREDTDE